ncbi:MAG: hypothetical protein LBR17_05870 [Bacteroidales bacterium]|jgi:hypothetical protein|nr:hypothetical protein [Bacteroidales bacterium]
MKQIFTLIAVFLLLQTFSFAQNDSIYQKYKQKQQKAEENFKKTSITNQKTFSDSLNSVYASFLAQRWTSFKLYQEERSFKPMPKPPVFDTTQPIYDIPEPLPIKPIPPIEPPKPIPITPIPIVPTPTPIPQNTINSSFFGTSIKLTKLSLKQQRLTGISEKEIANHWNFLTSLQYNDWIAEVLRIKTELNLNDWAVYKLLENVFKVYFNGSENEEVVFSIFTLNQMGYKAKIGRANGELFPMVAFQNKLSNTPTFIYNETRYYVLNQSHKGLSSIESCNADYGNAPNVMDLALSKSLRINTNLQIKELKYNSNTYAIKYNKNLVSFYSTYPLMDFAFYADAPIDKLTMESLKTELLSQIKGTSQEYAINFLLHFVQNAFIYKTDDEQFGYEKWNFAEETIASLYSDCDDRAIFFAQLVKELLDMNVVLIYYPGYHLATAVKFNNSQTQGDYVIVDNVKYLICDPTYTDANLGTSMPQLRNIPIEIIKLK